MALDISVIVGSILMAIGGLLVLIGLILCYTTKVSVFCCYWWFILARIEIESSKLYPSLAVFGLQK